MRATVVSQTKRETVAYKTEEMNALAISANLRLQSFVRSMKHKS